MKTQKYLRGDLVRVAADLGPSMRHFPKDFDAVVMGSYRDKYGGTDDHSAESYTLMDVKDGNQISWYEESQLTLIRHIGEKGIKDIETVRDAREAVESDMAWIVANWKRIRENPPSATMGELMRRIGIKDPWGARGEGLDLYRNMQFTFAALDPILQTGDSPKIIEWMDMIRAEIENGKK